MRELKVQNFDHDLFIVWLVKKNGVRFYNFFLVVYFDVFTFLIFGMNILTCIENMNEGCECQGPRGVCIVGFRI